jgi:membrane protease YdiL (CAAX protease family)
MTDPDPNPQPPRPAEPTSPAAPPGVPEFSAGAAPSTLDAPTTFASATLTESAPVVYVPPDLNVPWGWWDIVLFLLFYLGSIFVFGIVALIAGSAILHIPLPELPKHTLAVVTLAILAQGVASIAALVYFWVMVRLRKVRGISRPDEGFWQVMGWHSLGPSGTTAKKLFLHILGGVALALGISLASNFIGQPGPVPFEDFFKTRQTVLMMMAFGILIAPLVEEMMFRAFLYPVVARSFGVGTGVIVTGVLFGATHAPQLSGAWGQIALIVGVGLVLTWARAHSKTVLSSFLLHVSYNTTLFAGLVIASHGLRNL